MSEEKKKMGAPTKYREEMCDKVIQGGKEGKSQAEIALDLNINESTYHDWKKNNPDFSKAVKESLRYSQGWWEKNGRLATFGGVDGFNATSYGFNMKNRFKEDWSDTSKSEIAGAGGKPLNMPVINIVAVGKDDGKEE